MYLATLLLKSLDSRWYTTAVSVENINECSWQRHYCSKKKTIYFTAETV